MDCDFFPRQLTSVYPNILTIEGSTTNTTKKTHHLIVKYVFMHSISVTKFVCCCCKKQKQNQQSSKLIHRDI